MCSVVIRLMYPLSSWCICRLLPFFPIINNAAVFAHVSLYTCIGVSPGCVPRSAITEKIVLLSALLDTIRLLSKVAVSNSTWNNVVWVACTKSKLVFLVISWSQIHFPEYYWGWVYFHVHWLCMIPFLWFAHSSFWPFFTCVFLFWFGEVFKYILIKKLPTMQETPRQRSLVGCSAWGREESVTTEWLHHHHH